MQGFVLQYYAWLSGLSGFLANTLGSLADSANLPMLSALVFGVIGAAAPCQISGSVVTLAYLARESADEQRLWAKAVAFLFGKLTVYTLIGGGIVALGLQLDQIKDTAIPVVIVARRAMGPLLILVGLILLGVLKSRLTMGGRLSDWIDAHARGQKGLLPAYLLGLALSFTFCPTLFWLFFGLTIPLALASSGGMLFPSVFAVGTALPVLALAGLLASGTLEVGPFLRRFKSAEIWLQRIAWIVFILVGVQEMLLYWFL